MFTRFGSEIEFISIDKDATVQYRRKDDGLIGETHLSQLKMSQAELEMVDKKLTEAIEAQS